MGTGRHLFPISSAPSIIWYWYTVQSYLVLTLVLELVREKKGIMGTIETTSCSRKLVLVFPNRVLFTSGVRFPSMFGKKQAHENEVKEL